MEHLPEVDYLHNSHKYNDINFDIKNWRNFPFANSNTFFVLKPLRNKLGSTFLKLIY